MQDYGGYGAYGGGYPPPPPAPPQRPSFWRYVAVAVAAGALGAGAVVAADHIGSSGTPAAIVLPNPSSSAPQQVLPSQGDGGGDPSGGLGDGGLGSDGLSAADQAIYNKVTPGLVIINTSLNYQTESAAGTGMVLNSN